LIVVAGYRFRGLSFPEIGFSMTFGWFAYPLTVLWILGIINALNLIDGVDGLAGGLSSIIIGSYGVIYWYRGHEEGLWLSVLLIAVIFGFLVFNAPLPKAKIFMGDTGSQFLGFFIAMIPLMERSNQGQATVSLPYAAGLTLIPIFDTFAAIWRRTRDKRNIYDPDREHTHHKLLALGFTALEIDGIMYGIQLICAMMIVLAQTVLVRYRILLTLGAYGVVGLFFTLLHYVYSRRVKGVQHTS
ncbi:MAG: MraY family glycosyltransferase, partial [Termitinemataceae bacterium]